MKVFIDGSSGTTGLRIAQRLGERKDVEMITLTEALRKDPSARKDAINSADIAVLCLPDQAAREAVAMVESTTVTVFDTSTAHRTLPDWSYGFPELSNEHLEGVKTGKRIAVPGCHASGFIALVYPLIEAGAIDSDVLLCCHSLTGYSGGGKSMIAQYEAPERDIALSSPRQYGVTQNHKHLPEMKKVCSLQNEPVFCPIVADFYSGMEVTVPLFASQLKEGFTMESIKEIYAKKYSGPVVRFKEDISSSGFIAANGLAVKDSMDVCVLGNSDRILLTALYNNLGKGASGAAVQCINISQGLDQTLGLEL
ncbi:MAG: N-acetyl-gamma-glutamyl-phosphate reductase [Oscillospiraceae bacterium]|nr:N-acetyl-gamma-glutamyl-phosphate reductase [Oscillospiraceae bacterium]